MRGGDRLWGAPDSGPGHAGRRQILAIVCLACSLLAALSCLMPRLVQAQEGYVTWRLSDNSFLPEILGSDGSRGYCAQEEKIAPDGTAYREWHWLSEMDSATLRGDPHGLCWLVARCYPRTDVFGGTTLSTNAAARVSQAAIWMYQGDLDRDRHMKGRAGLANLSEEETKIAWALAQEAHTHDGEAGPWDRIPKYWTSSKSSLQGLIALPPTGTIVLSKKDAEPTLSAGNASYRLEGAVFGLFRDQSCTDELQSFTVDADGKATLDHLDPGTYYVKEKQAPDGYLVNAEAYPVEVAGNQTASLSIPETPRHTVPDLLIQKKDSQTGDSQGDATLEGAVFTARFWASGRSTDDTPDRTWVLKTDSEGHIRLDDSHKASGDDFYLLADGTVALPLGTLVVEETEAPAGYLLPESSAVTFRISPDDTAPAGAVLLQASAVAEDVARGGVTIQKLDRETGEAISAGKASLAGSIFSIVNESAHPVLVDGNVAEPGAVCLEIAADEQGHAASAPDALPYGRYRVKETKAGAGYKVNESWEETFSIGHDGEIVALGQERACANQVIRGDLSFVKQDAATAARMGKVPFRIVSRTTGEWHIALTDENGCLDTSAAFRPHTLDTNANDKALKEDGTLDESLLAPDAGIWFSGHADRDVPADDGLGALPFDDYTIEELPSSANQGKKLVSFAATITRDGWNVHLGTVSNEEGPRIGTTLSTEEGEQIVSRDSGPIVLVDTVAYANLVPGKTYELTGTLMDYATKEPLEGCGPVSVSFVPDASSGTQEVAFRIDALPETTRRVVAFESLEQDGVEVAVHADIEDEGQTIRFSRLHTIAASQTGGKTIAAQEHALLTDTVQYEGLVPGRTYKLVATLHLADDEGRDEGALADASGSTLTFSHEFVPESENGTAEVPIRFDARELAGKTVVVFESLSHNGHEVGHHRDIASESQSLRFVDSKTPDTGDIGGIAWMALCCTGLAALAGGIVFRIRH